MGEGNLRAQNAQSVHDDGGCDTIRSCQQKELTPIKSPEKKN